jgi:hypothetical protein
MWVEGLRPPGHRSINSNLVKESSFESWTKRLSQVKSEEIHRNHRSWKILEPECGSRSKKTFPVTVERKDKNYV